MESRISSISEKPIRRHPRRLADWLELTGARKVHSLVDKIYKRKNGEMGLVNLISLIPTIAQAKGRTLVKA
jgi:uncharacterized protein YabN with tetrapyrrole methylase and pyrophosphatase domain